MFHVVILKLVGMPIHGMPIFYVFSRITLVQIVRTKFKPLIVREDYLGLIVTRFIETFSVVRKNVISHLICSFTGGRKK